MKVVRSIGCWGSRPGPCSLHPQEFGGRSRETLPERIPIRFDLGGTPNGWGDGSTALILFVGIGFVMGLMALISVFSQRSK